MPSKRCATSAKRSVNCLSGPVTNRMACQSRCEIPVQASRQKLLSACSRLSTPQNRVVWGLGCRSAGRLSKRITDDCGRALTCHVALFLASLRLLIRSPHRKRTAASDPRRSRRLSGTLTLYGETQWDHYGRCRLSVALGNATRVMRFCWRQLQFVGHARQVGHRARSEKCTLADISYVSTRTDRLA